MSSTITKEQVLRVVRDITVTPLPSAPGASRFGAEGSITIADRSYHFRVNGYLTMYEAFKAAMDASIQAIVDLAEQRPDLRKLIDKANRAVVKARNPLRVIDGGKP